ncbi:MAG TPA: hypothetical protein VGK48_06110 [Terriglobia bacterium]
MDQGAYAKRQVTQYIANTEFTQATLHFIDGSELRFEHASRSNRWARASAPGTIADEICKVLRQFRLNAKHLQLFFDDGTNVEFI